MEQRDGREEYMHFDCYAEFIFFVLWIDVIWLYNIIRLLNNTYQKLISWYLNAELK